MTNNTTNWNFWQCPVETPPSQFGPFADLVSLWQGRIVQPGGLPARADFDFMDFRGWFGRVAIARIARDPFEVRFSLWGTQLTDWWGTDYTGRKLGESANDPEAWLQTEGRYFQSMAAAPFIGVASGGLDQHDRSFIRVLGLDLPLGDASGLTHVLAVHMQIDQGATPETVLPDCPLVSVAIG